MAGILAALKDKRERAVQMARFRAWWEGEDFDETAARAGLAEEPPPGAPAPVADKPALGEGAADALFDEEPAPPPRLVAVQKFWGEARLMPGEAEEGLLAALGLASEGALALIGPGLPGPLLALAQAHPGRIVAYEWRDETRAALGFAIKRANLGERVEMRAAEPDGFKADPDAFDGALSLDEFTYASDAAALARCLAKSLKQGAPVCIEAYAGARSPAHAPAFATAFAETHLRTRDELTSVIADAGLAIESDDDVTASHHELAKAGLKHLERALADAGDALNVAVLQEIAWEASAWRARMKLLTQRRLERRRIVARKE